MMIYDRYIPEKFRISIEGMKNGSGSKKSANIILNKPKSIRFKLIVLFRQNMHVIRNENVACDCNIYCIRNYIYH